MTEPRKAGGWMRWRRGGLAAIVVLLVLGGGVGVWWSWFATYHFAAVEEGVLYRDGNRGMREFRTALRRARPRTVICLVETQEIENPELPQFLQEKEMCRREGIRFVHIPLSRKALPKDEDVKRFLEILADPSSRPVLVHCAQGVRRTGMMVAAYQQAALGYDDDAAKSAILPFGHSERSLADVRRFIDLYEPGKPFR